VKATTMPESWLTKAELAAALKVSPRTVTRLNPPCTKVGNQNRYYLSEVKAFLRGVPEQGGNVVPFPLERTRGGVAA
jgi:hypothetical protein